MLNSSIWRIHRTLSGATTPGQSGPWSSGNEEVLCIPQSIRLFSVISRTLMVVVVGVLTLLLRCSQCILQPQLTGLKQLQTASLNKSAVIYLSFLFFLFVLTQWYKVRRNVKKVHLNLYSELTLSVRVRIYRLYCCSGVRTFPCKKKRCPHYNTKLHLMVRHHF